MVIGAALIDGTGVGPGNVEAGERHRLVRSIDEKLVLRPVVRLPKPAWGGAPFGWK